VIDLVRKRHEVKITSIPRAIRPGYVSRLDCCPKGYGGVCGGIDDDTGQAFYKPQTNAVVAAVHLGEVTVFLLCVPIFGPRGESLEQEVKSG
jgi:hypothetical protein